MVSLDVILCSTSTFLLSSQVRNLFLRGGGNCKEGSYAGWGHVDADLISIYLFGHPKFEPSKLIISTIMEWPSKDVSKHLSHVYLWEVPLSLQVREDPQVSQMQPA